MIGVFLLSTREELFEESCGMMLSIAMTDDDAHISQDESNPEYYESATKHQCQPEQKDNFDVPRPDSTSQSMSIEHSTHCSFLPGHNRVELVRKYRDRERSRFNKLRRVLGEHIASNEKVLTIAHRKLLKLTAEYARRH